MFARGNERKKKRNDDEFARQLRIETQKQQHETEIE